jgi:hypothetical protein
MSARSRRWKWHDVGLLAEKINMQKEIRELRRFYGQSGKVYYVFRSTETYYDAFLETADGFLNVEAKATAIDCGSTVPHEKVTHKHWDVLWQGARENEMTKSSQLLSSVAFLLSISSAHAETMVKEEFRCLHVETLELFDQSAQTGHSMSGLFKSGECSEALKIGTSVRVDKKFEYPLKGTIDLCVAPVGSSEPCQWVSSEVVK